MKTLKILMFLILVSAKLFGQFQVNAGNDTIICVELWDIDTLYLGGNPTASGGVEPYSYTWSAKYAIGPLVFWASDFLDDTTSANPRLIDFGLDRIGFKLIAKDGNGYELEDSITVRFSIFLYLTTSAKETINQGDTITLCSNIIGGIEPLNHYWSPNYNISDTTACNPSVWPDTSTIYSLYVTDSIGCVSHLDYYRIFVNPSGIFSANWIKYKSTVFPNPLTENSIISLSSFYQNKLKIVVYDVSGKIVLNDGMRNPYRIGEKINKKGVYFYQILYNSEPISFGKFIK